MSTDIFLLMLAVCACSLTPSVKNSVDILCIHASQCTRMQINIQMYQDAFQMYGMQECTGCQLIFFTDALLLYLNNRQTLCPCLPLLLLFHLLLGPPLLIYHLKKEKCLQPLKTQELLLLFLRQRLTQSFKREQL